MKLPAVGLVVGPVIVLALGCSTHTHGPAWPKLHDRIADGGESLAPHAASPIATAAAATGDDAAISELAPAATAVAPAATPAIPVATPAGKTPDEPVMTEELIIEIDD